MWSEGFNFCLRFDPVIPFYFCSFEIKRAFTLFYPSNFLLTCYPIRGFCYFLYRAIFSPLQLVFFLPSNPPFRFALGDSLLLTLCFFRRRSTLGYIPYPEIDASRKKCTRFRPLGYKSLRCFCLYPKRLFCKTSR